MSLKTLAALAPLLALASPSGVAAAPPAISTAVEARSAAKVEPARHGFQGATQVWPYAAGALYQLYASPGRVSDIALQPGEALVSVSAGDTARWIIGDTKSGAGAEARAHVLVKPTAPDLKTNLLIHTDRRAYHLELTAGPSAWMAAVAWRYPEGELIALRTAAAQVQAASPVAEGVALERLNFGYAIRGARPAWRPLLAFDDGQRVYLRFPDGVAQAELPPLFIVGAKGQAQLVNYRSRPPYYVVDSLFTAAELRLGARKQVRVRIERTDGRKRAGPRR